MQNIINAYMFAVRIYTMNIIFLIYYKQRILVFIKNTESGR